MADLALGQTAMFLSDFKISKECGERTIVRYMRNQDSAQPEMFWFGYDTGALQLADAAIVYALLGDLEKAQMLLGKAVALIRQFYHPYSLVYTLSLAAMVQYLCGNAEACQKVAEEAIAVAEKYSLRQNLAHAQIFLGWAQAHQGHFEVGIEQLRHGIAGWLATGAQIAHTYFLLLLSDAHRHADQLEAGLAVIAEAEAIAAESGEHWMDAEHCRLKGELMRLRGDPKAAVAACFHQAIEIARTQGAKLLELRGVLSLARLYREDQQAAAREILAAMVTQFAHITEPDVSKDLSDALVLLQELA